VLRLNMTWIFESAVRFGLIDSREDTNAQESFKNMIQVTMEPFQLERQPFDFSDPGYEKRTIEANLRFTKSLKYSPPPRKIIFLHRKLGGIFNMVKRMNVALDLLPYWTKMTAPATRHAQLDV
jgi:aarF domain-containing kinase